MGGGGDLWAGLMDLAADSFLDQLLDLLGTLSNLSAQGHIKIAVELAQPIIEGLDGLIGVQGLRTT